jgi:cyanate permease
MSTSSLPLMFVYAVTSVVLQALGIGAIVMIEPYIEGWSGVVFMVMYLVAFWLAWIISVRVTEPRKKAEPAEAAQPSQA